MQLINGRQELLKVQEMPSLCRSHSYLQQVLLTHRSKMLTVHGGKSSLAMLSGSSYPFDIESLS